MKTFFATFLILMACTLSHAKPPTDPKEKQVYSHNKEWLASYPASFIATNIRGKGLQYKERRQAALDLLVEKNEKAQAPALLEELKRGSFLSDQLCEALGKWNYHRAVPTLTVLKDDAKQTPEVRKAAEKALAELSKPESVDPGPPVITTN